MLLLVVYITLGSIITAYLVYSIVEATYVRKNRIQQRIQKLTEEQSFEIVETHISDTDANGNSFPTIEKYLAGSSLVDKLLVLIMQAGVKLRPSELIGISSGLALILALLMSLVAKNLAGEILGIVIGAASPFVYLKALASQRLVTFNRQIPDALSLLASAIRGGFGFQRALQMISEEMPNPISEEFERVLNEINVGVSNDVALMNMTTRVTSYDLQLVVTAIIIQQQIGGNLAEILDNIALTIRERVKVEGEVAALTAEGKMSGVVLIGLPFVLAIMISVMNPGYLTPLISSSIGQIMIGTALVLQIIGAIVIKRMVALDY